MKKKGFLDKFLVVVLAGLLSSCTSQDGQGRYRVATIGNAVRAVDAEVLSAAPAFVEFNSGAGATAGGVLGGALAADSSDSAAVLIAGVIGGALIGNAAERGARRANATQYLLVTENDAKIVVAQLDADNEVYEVGAKVILVYGYPAQLIREPNSPQALNSSNEME